MPPPHSCAPTFYQKCCWHRRLPRTRAAPVPGEGDIVVALLLLPPLIVRQREHGVRVEPAVPRDIGVVWREPRCRATVVVVEPRRRRGDRARGVWDGGVAPAVSAATCIAFCNRAFFSPCASGPSLHAAV
jgi:hypothetical protein